MQTNASLASELAITERSENGKDYQQILLHHQLYKCGRDADRAYMMTNRLFVAASLWRLAGKLAGKLTGGT